MNGDDLFHQTLLVEFEVQSGSNPDKLAVGRNTIINASLIAVPGILDHTLLPIGKDVVVVELFRSDSTLTLVDRSGNLRERFPTRTSHAIGDDLKILSG